MLCVSAVYAVILCPSVRPSVTFMYSVELSGSHAVLVFPYQTLWQSSNGDPLTGAKITIFDQHLSSLLDRQVSSTL